MADIPQIDILFAQNLLALGKPVSTTANIAAPLPSKRWTIKEDCLILWNGTGSAMWGDRVPNMTVQGSKWLPGLTSDLSKCQKKLLAWDQSKAQSLEYSGAISSSTMC